MLSNTFAYIVYFLFVVVVGCLRDVSIDIPAAVAFGETVILSCTYDLEGDDLYSVKWYKGRDEFFRYVPKELPHIKVFPTFGINVDVSILSASELFMKFKSR